MSRKRISLAVALALLASFPLTGATFYTELVTKVMILAIFAYAPVAVLVLRFHWLGLPGIWVALGLWLAARSALLGRRWARAVSEPDAVNEPRPDTRPA